MPGISSHNKKQPSGRKAGPGKKKVVIVLVAAFVLLAAACVFFRPVVLQSVLFLARRTGNTFCHYLLKSEPQFYYLLVEKNGRDMRLSDDEALEITYRDEFIIKSVASDDLGGKFTGVTVEGIGDRGNHLGMGLRGVDFVNAIMQGESGEMGQSAMNAYKIRVYYKNKDIALIPLHVGITPQDWLRFAEKFSSSQKSISYLKEAMEKNVNDTGVRRVLAGIYLKQNKHVEAAAIYEEILRLTPDDAGVIKDLARCYIQSGRFGQAAEILSRLIASGKQDAGVFSLLGEAYGGKNDWSEAVGHYSKALESEPDNDGLRLLMAGACERAGQTDAAIGQYLEITKKSPDDLSAWRGLGALYLKNKKYRQALDAYTRVIKASPDDAYAYVIWPSPAPGWAEIMKK